MLHHVSLGTNDLSRARVFYDALFEVLGLRLTQQDEISWHYGVSSTVFSIIRPINDKPATIGNGTHVAFAADTRAIVDNAYHAAIENGGTSDGAPGIRMDYDANYYAAFIRDPDGNKLEIVTYSAK